MVCKLAQVPIVPCGFDAAENGRSLFGPVPADAKPIPVRRFDPKPGVEALIDQGIKGFLQQVIEMQGRTGVGKPATHVLLLSVDQVSNDTA